MNIFDVIAISIITAEQVKPRKYFLMELMIPEIIWAIRIIGIFLGLTMLCVYIGMKKNDKNGE